LAAIESLGKRRPQRPPAAQYPDKVLTAYFR
jgi:hypothetical protein